MPAIVELNIDPEFQSWIPALRKEERGQLEENIKANGCLEPLIVWSEEFTLLDGHNRYEICHKNKIPFEFREISLPDRDAALQWMLKHQLGRRNLTPEQMSTLRGALYNSIKKAQGGTGANQHKEQRAQNDTSATKTADTLASQFNVSPATIKRDGQFAKAVETLRSADPEAAELAMSGAVNKADVLAVAKEPEKAKESAQVIKQKAEARRRREPTRRTEQRAPSLRIVRLSDTRDDLAACIEDLKSMVNVQLPTSTSERLSAVIDKLSVIHSDLCKRC